MSMEAVLIIPAFLLFLLALAAVATVSGVRQDVHSAAVQAARVASLESSAQAGVAAGREAATVYLAHEATPCQEKAVEVWATALNLPSGQSGSVTARVTCVVSLAQFTGIGLPGQIQVQEEFTSQIDAYVPR
jgi:Flp pilus assembly protein TadG